MKQLLLIMSLILSLGLIATSQAYDKPPEVSSPVVNKLDDGVYSIFLIAMYLAGSADSAENR